MTAASPSPIMKLSPIMNECCTIPLDFAGSVTQRYSNLHSGPLPTDDPVKEKKVIMERALTKYGHRWTRGLESEIKFWRVRLKFDPEGHSDDGLSYERLRHWAKTGQVKTWAYDDMCAILNTIESPKRILNVAVDHLLRARRSVTLAPTQLSMRTVLRSTI